MYKCNRCNEVFTKSYNLNRHNKSIHGDLTFTCELCNRTYNRKDILERHLRTVHAPASSSSSSVSTPIEEVEEAAPSTVKRRYCEDCDSFIVAKHFSGHLRSNAHKSKAFVLLRGNIQVSKGAFKNRIISYKINNEDDDKLNFNNFFATNRGSIRDLILNCLDEHNSVKLNFELFGVYSKVTNDEYKKEIKSFNSKYQIVTKGTNLNDLIDKFIETILKKADEFQERDSGWALEEILFLEVNFAKYNPLRGSTYLKLPREIANKKACINVKNDDEACFFWAVLSALKPVERNSCLPETYGDYRDSFNCDNIDLPVNITDIAIFEDQNANISVNVFGLDDANEIIGPLYHTKERKINHVNLLLFFNKETTIGHYVWIKNMSRLVSMQLSRHRAQKFICDGCLSFFNKRGLLERHQQEDCLHIRAILPCGNIARDGSGRSKVDNIVKFEHFERKMEVPFAIYADFECILKPLPREDEELNDSQSYTIKINRHEPFAFAYRIKCSYDDALSVFRTYTGSDCVEVFIKWLIDDATNIGQRMAIIKPLRQLSQTERVEIYSNRECHICGKDIAENEKPALDHCHLTGEPRSLTHALCNLTYKVPKFIEIRVG